MAKFNKPCGFADPKADKCLLTGMEINPNDCHCSKYRSKVYKCARCGTPLINEIIDISDPENPHFLCDKCAPLLNSCANCQHSRTCAFEADPSPNKIVQKQIQNGPMTQIVQIRNPEIVEKTCKKCSCFSDDFGCSRENNYCERRKPWKTSSSS